ncbi:MAG: SlyX family protein [Planctomycetes bacterium]|nr:SlyX family protein [Planctomycetota bacterium]
MTADWEEPGRVAKRVTDLEELFTHLQRQVQDLDQVVLRQQKQIEKLQAELRRLSIQLAALSEPPPEPRSLEDERPPHY